MPAGCEEPTFSPEVYEFYGDADTISKKLDRVPMTLKDRRVFYFVIEDDSRANLRLFEWKDGDDWGVSTWQGSKESVPRAELQTTFLRNKGVHCLGEQAKAQLKDLGLKSAGAVPGPESPRAAFSHTLREFGGDYVHATVALLC